MLIIYLITILLAFYGISFSRKDFINSPFAIEVTHSINGIFIILVFCRHIFQYIYLAFPQLNMLDSLGGKIDVHLYQLLVVPFLFFSGYGLTISAEYKRGGYINRIPIYRCQPVLLNFMIAVCFFAVLQVAIGNRFSLEKFLLSLICWESIGNSNWYIFCILWCYLFSYVGYKITKSKMSFLVTVWLLSFLYIVAPYKFKGSYWYYTILAYPTGVTFATYRNQLMGYIKRKWLLSITIMLILFVTSYYVLMHHPDALVHNVTSVMVCLVMLIVMMKVRIQNRYLEWMGKNLFPLYIYMRIPMILFSKEQNFVISYEPLYIIIVCIVITLMFGYTFRCFRVRL